MNETNGRMKATLMVFPEKMLFGLSEPFWT